MTVKFVGHITTLQYFSLRKVELMKTGLLSYLIRFVCEVTHYWIMKNFRKNRKNRLETANKYGFGFQAKLVVSVSVQFS